MSLRPQSIQPTAENTLISRLARFQISIIEERVVFKGHGEELVQKVLGIEGELVQGVQDIDIWKLHLKSRPIVFVFLRCLEL